VKTGLVLVSLLAAGLALSACAQETRHSGHAAPGGGAPNLHRHDNGSITVRYDNGCVVTYNKDGRRSGSNGCRPGQVERADTAVQEDAQAHGGGGLKFHKRKDGTARVTFNDGCVVTYNRKGDRTGSSGCHASQVERADRAAQNNW